MRFWSFLTIFWGLCGDVQVFMSICGWTFFEVPFWLLHSSHVYICKKVVKMSKTSFLSDFWPFLSDSWFRSSNHYVMIAKDLFLTTFYTIFNMCILGLSKKLCVSADKRWKWVSIFSDFCQKVWKIIFWSFLTFLKC